MEFRCIFQLLFRRHGDADMALESARPTVSMRKFVLIINEVILGILGVGKRNMTTKGISTVCLASSMCER